MHCTITITVQQTLHVSLTFIDFDLQDPVRGQCLDYVSVEMYQNIGSPQIVCGNISDLPISHRGFESRSNWMILTFHSDYAIEGRGYQAFYSAAKTCLNESYYQDNGTITSMNYPANYLNNQECFIFISVTNPWYVVELQFEMLHTEAKLPTYLSDLDCDMDYVEIQDDSRIHRRCGNWNGRENQLKFRSHTRAVLVRFVSNRLGTAPGFRAVWRAVVNDTSKLPCPAGWQGVYEYCYKIFNSPKVWLDAKQKCDSMDSFLTSITSKAVMNMLDYLIKNRSVRQLSC